jgi:predicted aspartyl protease
MRIDGYWARDEDVLTRPVFRIQVMTATGEWLPASFLLDTGADRTVICADVLNKLEKPTTQAVRQLGGVGGAVETLEVWTDLKFSRSDGGTVVVNGRFAAFTDPFALEESVLGRDILARFAIVVDEENKTLCLLHGRHRAVIQES